MQYVATFGIVSNVLWTRWDVDAEEDAEVESQNHHFSGCVWAYLMKWDSKTLVTENNEGAKTWTHKYNNFHILNECSVRRLFVVCLINWQNISSANKGSFLPESKIACAHVSG